MLADSPESLAIHQRLGLGSRNCYLRQGTAAEDVALVSLRTRPSEKTVLRGAVVDKTTGIGGASVDVWLLGIWCCVQGHQRGKGGSRSHRRRQCHGMALVSPPQIRPQEIAEDVACANRLHGGTDMAGPQ